MKDPKKSRWKDERVWFGLAALLLLLVSIPATIWQWNWLSTDDLTVSSNSETLRNVGFLIGGVLAIVFASWRAWVAGRQANAAQGQVETAQRQAHTAQQSLLNDQYQRGADMLSSNVLAVRLGGIYALQNLAEKSPNGYHVQIMRLLCAFVRIPPQDQEVDKPSHIDGEVEPSAIRDDAQAAISVIGLRDLGLTEHEKDVGFTSDLHGANLIFAYLVGHHLENADLSFARLEFANLEGASLARSSLTNAHLYAAKLDGANFKRSTCKWAHFADSRASRANFHRADLEGTYWANAHLQGANLTKAILSGADLTGANLAQSDISGAFIGLGGFYPNPTLAVIERRNTALTQGQLDMAIAAGDAPPRIDEDTKDTETGERLIWRPSRPIIDEQTNGVP